MDGIDTNVLVRYLVKDDLKQHQQALALLKALPKIYLSPIVLVETVWVLSHFYKVNAEKQCQKLRELLCLQCIMTDNRQAVLNAIVDYTNGYNFADAMIGHHNNLRKCKTTWTFDKKAVRLKQFTRLEK
ncbi:PIN domain-containing protein [Endozoicomonas sp. ONNA2]|uniref:PIN domain-containing protein n=1 Tax=Endozoicomonas sp. ONNA2 TaxID=2828741 RepID=UPI00214868DB|nr:type II toxin-antitoxin system VapC family toxin [Endozoicomonas sp. ONNA2]